MQGGANGLFKPSGAVRTHEWFVANGRFGAGNEENFVLQMVPGYGHLDHFIGRRAALDVFPKITSALDRMEQMVESAAN